MSVQELDKVDFVGFDPKSGAVQLVVSDHLDWDEQEGEHLLTLQKKLNAYLAFIETKQIYTDFPNAIGRNIIIRVMGKYPLSEEARKFYRLAGKYIEDLGISLQNMSRTIELVQAILMNLATFALRSFSLDANR